MQRTPILGALFVIFIVGCGDTRPPMATIKGTVTIDGRPLEKGLIQFESAGNSPASLEIKDGAYEGKTNIALSRVLIRSPKVVGQRKRFPTDDSPLDDVLEENIPPRYNAMSGLQIDVHQGENTYDVDLKIKDLPK